MRESLGFSGGIWDLGSLHADYGASLGEDWGGLCVPLGVL